MRWASRVFPMPPVPHSVEARIMRTNRHSSSTSRSRPTKLFGAWGRLVRISATPFPRR